MLFLRYQIFSFIENKETPRGDGNRFITKCRSAIDFIENKETPRGDGN